MSKKKQQKRTAKTKKPLLTRQHWMIAAIIGVFAFLIYANTLGHQYVLDDFSAIKENFVTQKGVEGIPTIWEKHYRYGYWNSSAALYRPLTLTVFALIWEVAPDNTIVYHFVNVLFYAFTALLLFILLCRLMPKYNKLFPLMATLLYVAHPMHVEVVANIKSLDEILSFFFCLKAIYLLLEYLDNKKKIYLIGSVVVYGMALFSKESSITFLAIIPLILYFFKKIKISEIAKWSALYLIPAVIFIAIRQKVVGGLGTSKTSFLDNVIYGADSSAEQLATTFLLLGKYLLTLIAPLRLSHDWGYSQIMATNFADWRVLLSLVLYLAIGAYAVIKIKSRDYIAFGLLFFLITFSIGSNVLIKIGTSFGDRMVYVASFGFCFALVYALFKILKVNMTDRQASLAMLAKQNALAVGIVGVLVLLFSVKTMSRNMAWKDSFTLNDTDINIAPNSAKLNYHYGLELIKKGLDTNNATEKQSWFTKGEATFNQALKVYPQYHDAYGQLGLVYYRKGDYKKAIEYYETAIKHKPNSPKVYSNMGIIYFQHQQNIPKAIEVYKKAVQLDPHYVDAYRNLGAAYAISGKFQDAIVQFTEALKYAENDATINFYLGSAYKDSGQLSKGQPYLDRACRLDQTLCK